LNQWIGVVGCIALAVICTYFNLNWEAPVTGLFVIGALANGAPR